MYVKCIFIPNVLDINCESQKVHAKIVCIYIHIFRSYLRFPFLRFLHISLSRLTHSAIGTR